MRSTDQQLQEIMRRAQVVNEKRIIRKYFRVSVLASCVCAVLLIASCINLPKLTVMTEDPGMQQYGSLLLSAPYMGYVIVGVLAFALGVCAALLCIHWNKLKQKETERK